MVYCILDLIFNLLLRARVIILYLYIRDRIWPNGHNHVFMVLAAVRQCTLTMVDVYRYRTTMTMNLMVVTVVVFVIFDDDIAVVSIDFKAEIFYPISNRAIRNLFAR